MLQDKKENIKFTTVMCDVFQSAKLYEICKCCLTISCDFFAGVTTTEILTAHIISQMVCMLMQMIIVITLTFWAFHVPCEGSLVTVIALVALQGFCGMCFGKENETSILLYLQRCHMRY
jgi:hypothetical protein